MDLDLVTHTGGRAVAVTVEADEGATVGDLRRAIEDLVGPADAPITAGSPPVPLDDAAPLTGLVSGTTVTFGTLGAGATVPAGGGTGLEAAVVGGLHAGITCRLTPGDAVPVGRAARGGLLLPDPEVSRSHARLLAAEDGSGATVTDAGSVNGIRFGAWRLDGPLHLRADQVVGLGESVLAVRGPAAGDAEVVPDPAGGTRLFNRPPRIRVPERLPELVVPAEPERPGGFRLPWAATLLPLLLCGALYFVVPGGYAAYLLPMMALSPLMAVATVVGDRRSGRREYARARAGYERARAVFETELEAAVAAEESAERAAYPDPSALVRRTGAGGADPAATLWQRRPGDPDFLRLRVGLASRPARLVLRPDPAAPVRAAETTRPDPPAVRDVPVTVDLADAGVLGVAGPRPMTLAAARALIVQAAVLHSPAELGLVLVTGRDTAADWEWATWLPHTLPASSAFACARMVATDAAQAEARLTELRRLVDERLAEQRSALGQGPPPGRALLVVLDGARRLRDLAGLGELLATGPAVGVRVLCVDTEETALADECGATLVATTSAGSRVTLRRTGRTPVEDVLADGLVADAAEAAARALAPLRLLGERGGDAALPDRVDLLDVAGLSPVTPAAIRERWAASPDGRCTTVLLGAGPAGPVSVDLRRDGPHALIAGTSGSGKSELLQTLVASLAAANTPDALTFVLVDYKGGSAFAACADLPHCVGLVTDLDGHLVGRALDSLTAELRRRERLFAGAGAKDIEDYWARTGARLPRLVIVVDEFASLVEELPDFVSGVVGIGMRGRSLGVHVVLATQRPGGVVTADLRANLNLRICLRVTATSESLDVIDVPDAARIPVRRPGRAYVRTGHGEPVAFQAARVGRPRAETDTARPPVRVALRRVETLGRSTAEAVPVEENAARTDLTDLVAAVREAAAGLPAPPRPWLPPLPEYVSLSALPGEAGVIGLADRPSAQAQEPFVLDLERTGPVAIAGMARAGRSTALRTLAASLARASSPADLHLYALDCGNQALAALTALPHCGAVVDGADSARVERLLAALHAEVARRQRVLAAGGHGSLAEQRGAAPEEERLPYVVVLLDRLEAFFARYAESDGGRLVDRVEELLRTGPGAGVTMVLTTDRSGFHHRVSSAVAARLVLRQATPDDAAAFGLDPRTTPRRMPPGRAVWTVTGEEVQVARDADLPAGPWADVPPERLPRRVDPLPEEIFAAEAELLRSVARPVGPAVCTPAVGGDHLGPVDVDLTADGGTFLVCGPQRSGRSTALAAIVAGLALPVLAVAPRPSPLRDLAGARGVLDVLTGEPADIALAVEDAAVTGPVALVVDDGELLGDHALTDALESFCRTARDTGSVLVAAATTDDVLANPYRGWLAAVRRSRSGLLLNPATHVDGEVFGLRLPRSLSGGWPAGRALLVRRGETTPVQVITQVNGEAGDPDESY
ncbi:FtsK/SpoIIIE domain-containing protein [Actinoallomurus iriomotensis]|uniref:Uncharacterized protein n=1 Tax=Actinoallomurus iriomotensis TaxID=478107 RepID=A0A9W6S6I1_9ACTN|nr:FtsK/SpoIIIE domain-containing protein [Actinoallomurus iriomotensis]GLY86582.1 hypothetical protein Airi02_045110 [Actinoallomurus iriomotensis]